MLLSDTTLTLLGSRLRFSTDKLANTFLFRGELTEVWSLDLGSVVPLATLLVHGQYRGSAVRTRTFAIRDDADALIRYEQPLAFDTSLSVIVAHTVALSQDSRAIGLNRLMQLGLSGGMQWKQHYSTWQPFEQISARLLGGWESNEQLSISDYGWSLMGAVSAKNLNLEGYTISADVSGFQTNLSNTRINSQLTSRIAINRRFDGDAYLEVLAQYTGLERDFYVMVQQGVSTELAVEKRLERLFRMNTRFVLPILKNVDAEMQGFVETWAVGRQYGRPLDRVPLTAVRRDIDQLRFSINTTLRAQLFSGFHALGFSVDNRNEANRIVERFPIADIDVQSLRNAEMQRDNISVRWTLWAQTTLPLSLDDSLRVEYSTSLLRYDTPSILNNDDRDELFINLHSAYTHSFSHILSCTILAEMRLAHLVFIKAQRSAQNNWNRIIRLAPYMSIRSSGVELRPQFEVLANYTSFDFEDVVGTVQSFSLRQIAYRDSIRILVTSGTALESRLLFRYFERGEFRWREFSETPRDRNIEAFVQMLCLV
ncbi:MAG: hypothetical protein RML40_08450, partial [Bacteroidota bacterium]|nr:hypothetical protein [Candidatus Kapabacteria bacterium]MDW8220546.1 hypothetical protein [Bacteroidota bacterium]